MNLVTILKYQITDGLRQRMWRKSESDPSLRNLNWPLLVFLIVYLVLSYFLAFQLMGPLVDVLEDKGYNPAELLTIIEVMCWFGAMFLGALGCLSVCFEYHGANQLMGLLPVRQDLIPLVYLIETSIEKIVYLVFLVMPVIVLFSGVVNQDPVQGVRSALTFVVISFVIAEIFGFLLNTVLMLISAVKPAFAFNALFVIMLGGLLAAVLFATKGVSWGGPEAIVQVSDNIYNFGILKQGDSIILAASTRDLLLMFLVSIPALTILLRVNSKMMCIYKRRSSGKQSQFKTYSESKMKFLDSFRFSFVAFLKRDLIVMQRDPFVLVKQVGLLVLFLAILLWVMPKNSVSIVLLIIFNIPPAICGVIFLHSIGREGSFIYLILMATGLKEFLRAKTILAFLSVPLLSLVLSIAILVASPVRMGGEEVVIALGFVVINTVLSIFLVIGTASLFADFNEKRMRKEQGVTIPGEIIFWSVAGTSSVALYVVADSILDGDRILLGVGLGLVVALAFGTVVLYQAGMRRLATLA